ncbi:hypothetical protein DXG01_009621 [Tephrocybe rancida]|nr:hypothetical protein DXG01_009621 [Tephrocybe rancida]
MRDRTKEPFWHIPIPFCVVIVGYIIGNYGMVTDNVAARYVGLFLVGQAPAGYICFLAWISNSIPEPPAKRAVALGLTSSILPPSTKELKRKKIFEGRRNLDIVIFSEISAECIADR